MRLKTLKQHLNTKRTTTAVQSILEQAYHGNPSKELRDKCTRLKRFGKRWASLPQREWVLAPFEHAIEDFEKSKIQTIEIDALIEYGETLYNDECRKRLQEAFRRKHGKCISQWTSSASQIPSTSTKKRLRNRHSLSSRKTARNSAPQHSGRESDLFSSESIHGQHEHSSNLGGAPQTMLNTSVDSNISDERQCIGKHSPIWSRDWGEWTIPS